MTERPAPGVLAQMLLLLALSLAGTLVAYRFYDSPLPLRYAWAEHVERAALEKGMNVATVAATREIADAFSHIILDARREADYLAGHLPGALSLPAADFDRYFQGIAPLLTPEQPILVYCSGHDCDESLQLGEMLRQAGFTNLTLFVGGIKEWEDAGFPVER